MRVTLAILFLIGSTVADVCDYENSVELTNRTYNGLKYEVGEYFVDNVTGVERGCVCMKETCIRKCCPLGQAYDTQLTGCVEFTPEFNPPVYEGSNLKIGFNASKEFHFLINRMNCSKEKDEFRISVGKSTPNYHLETDGKLYVTTKDDYPQHLVYSPDKYCVDNFLSADEEHKNVSIAFNGLICFVFVPEENHHALNATCMLISCFFIILTVAVYASLPELRNLHGVVMITYLLCFFVGLFFLAMMDIMLIIENIDQNYCTSFTFVIYFSMLSAFFWLNVMCYDLYMKLRVPSAAFGHGGSSRDRYLKYSAYAFGVPTALTILVAALEFSDLPEDITLLPHLRRQGCFMNGLSRLLYFYTPIILTCVANLVFFILTARLISIVKKQTQMLNRKDSYRLSLYIKLFVVTGINWILDVVSAFYPNIPYLWHFVDAYNILIGFIIFVIFVCKKKIFIAIKTRYNELRGRPQARAPRCTISRASQKATVPKDNIQMMAASSTTTSRETLASQ